MTGIVLSPSAFCHSLSSSCTPDPQCLLVISWSIYHTALLFVSCQNVDHNSQSPRSVSLFVRSLASSSHSLSFHAIKNNNQKFYCSNFAVAMQLEGKNVETQCNLGTLLFYYNILFKLSLLILSATFCHGLNTQPLL